MASRRDLPGFASAALTLAGPDAARIGGNLEQEVRASLRLRAALTPGARVFVDGHEMSGTMPQEIGTKGTVSATSLQYRNTD